jgi:hypothetical protein
MNKAFPSSLAFIFYQYNIGVKKGVWFSENFAKIIKNHLKRIFCHTFNPHNFKNLCSKLSFSENRRKLIEKNEKRVLWQQRVRLLKLL